MSTKKLSKVNESITVHRYDNGWMVEVSGRDHDNEWVSSKTVCNTEDQVLDLIREYNSTPLE